MTQVHSDSLVQFDGLCKTNSLLKFSPIHFFNFQESEKIIAELNETWEEKLRKTEAIRMERYDITNHLLLLN